MDEFDKFEGDKGTIQPDEKNKNNHEGNDNKSQQYKDMPKIKEDFASFITLDLQDIQINTSFLSLSA